MPARGYSPARVAAIVSLVCLGGTIFQLAVGYVEGGLPPEAVLFAALAVIFAALWWTLRERA